MTDDLVPDAPRPMGETRPARPGPSVEVFNGLPTWLRWSIWAALGVLVLTIVQMVSGTTRLTATSTSQQMLLWAIPIMLAGLGGLYSERAGVVNIGLEGMMILGTWCGAWGALSWGPWGGVIAGALGGALGGLLHAVATVQFGVDHIISGVAINLLAPNLARFMSERVFAARPGGSISQSPRVSGPADVTFPVLAGGQVGGRSTPDILGSIADANVFWISDMASVAKGLVTGVSLFTLVSLAFVPITAFVLHRTRFGLRLRVAGENPVAGESLGVDIYRQKYLGVLISGAFAGAAGAFIVLEMTGIYRGGQTTGRGFIGLAALIFGNWRARGVLAGSLLFAYPFGLSLVDFDADSGGEATRSLLLLIALALVGAAIWAWRSNRKADIGLAAAMAAVSFVWYISTDTAAEWLPNMMPYVIVLVVLVFAGQKLRPPVAAGQPFRRGDH